jgi:hypothetical protein
MGTGGTPHGGAGNPILVSKTISKKLQIWYNLTMPEVKERILALMRSATPPQTVAELVEKVGAKPPTVYSGISALLNNGSLSRDELPWRKDRDVRTKQGRPRGTHVNADLERKLQRIIETDDKDRVAAIRELRDLRSAGADALSPLIPNDNDAIKEALIRILKAAGREISRDAINEAFFLRDILLEQEATNGEAPQDLARPALGGDNLD